MTDERESEVLAAVVDLLHEVGYEGLTMDAVAAAAHCGKATLYRQWHSKQQLVATALRAGRPEGIAVPDTGSLRDDFHTLLLHMSGKATRETKLISGLARATLDDPELGRVLRETLIEDVQADLETMVARAVARGELAGRPAATAWLPQLVFSTMLSRPLFQGSYADAEYLVRFLDEALMPALLHS
ncbi:TetR/AcrR family transcriptional regulator [Streptomyces sp. RFCAC02]|uniref:TetR/AcrR family transcriptional regulator n=1 Tax=Streptomyces sp. RFCAC02 TaxID=2499143 RepID=UPI00143DE75C|nr:TetR/AcrR family transcriptional regulator [Streptomyces sp. RFCAC02]